MHIHYDIARENRLAVRIFPLEAQIPYVEITLLGYHADGTRCWLPPEVRTHNPTRCETAAMKQATDVAAQIIDLLQVVTNPEQVLVTTQGLPAAA